jgi:hypothetical protein
MNGFMILPNEFIGLFIIASAALIRIYFPERGGILGSSRDSDCLVPDRAY